MFQNFKNSFDFFIRQNTRFSRKNYCPNKKEVEQNNLENLWVLDVLEKYFPLPYKENLVALDIGSKNWSYATAQHKFFKQRSNDFTLTGVEIDAHRLYNNFYSRAKVAEFNIKGLFEAKYVAGDLLNLNQKFDAIIWLLPFLHGNSHKKWGLPKKLFNPEALLKHAYGLLNDGAMMFIVNQGEEEFEFQKELFKKLHIPYKPLGKLESEVSPYKLERYGSVVVKNSEQVILKSVESDEEIEKLSSLAYEIWRSYWGIILQNEQIEYMIEKFQSPQAIKDQIKKEDYVYKILRFEGEDVGYFGACPKFYNGENKLFLSKFYIKENNRGKGLGNFAFREIKNLAQKMNLKSIYLTVNKNNQNTIEIYEKWGFKTVDSAVSDIGNGFVMDDYIMELTLLA